MVIGDGLHDVLRVVEHACDGDVVDVFVLQRVHLRPLEGRHAAMRAEHEDADALLAAHGVLGGRAGIAGGGAEDVDLFSPLFQNVLEQVAKELHGHVLEGQRRTVREFEQAEFVHFEPMHRRDLGGVVAGASVAIHLGGVGFVADRLKVGSRDVIDEFREDGEGEFRVGKRAPRVELGTRYLRIGFRQIESAIRRQAAEQDVAEGLGRRIAACREVAHGVDPEERPRGRTACRPKRKAWILPRERADAQCHRKIEEEQGNP